VISDETIFLLEACKIGDVRYKVFRFQVSTDQKVGGSSPPSALEISVSCDQINS
jgi:hypothetical protein